MSKLTRKQRIALILFQCKRLRELERETHDPEKLALAVYALKANQQRLLQIRENQ